MTPMTYEEKLDKAIDIILENILTPVLYMYDDEVTEFIVFSDSRVMDGEVFRRTEAEISFNLGMNVEIIDMREFDQSDRTEIMLNAELLYSESDVMLASFEKALFEDMELQTFEKIIAIERKSETGTYYLN